MRRDRNPLSSRACGRQVARAPPAAGARHKVVSEFSAPAWSTSRFESDAGGHPALQEPKLVRQALAYGIDRVGDRAPAVGGLSLEYPALAPARQRRLLDRTARYYRPNWKRLPVPAGPGAAPARTGGLSPRRRRHLRAAMASGFRSASVTIAGIEPAGARRVELVQDQLRRVGVEVTICVCALRDVFFGTLVPRGDFDLASFAWSRRNGGRARGVHSACQRQRATSPATATAAGQPRPRPGRPQSSTTDERVALLNRVDVRLARAVPAHPALSDPKASSLSSDDPRRHPATPSGASPGTRRTGGSRSRASPRRGDRRLAPRASRGRAARTRRRRSAAARSSTAGRSRSSPASRRSSTRAFPARPQRRSASSRSRCSRRRTTSAPTRRGVPGSSPTWTSERRDRSR